MVAAYNFTMKMGRRGCLKACASILCAITSSPLSAVQPLSATSQPKMIHRQLRFTIVLSNPRADDLLDQTLWFYLPIAETATQRINAVKVSMPYALLSDELNHRILKLVFPSVAPLASKVVTIVTDVMLNSAVEPRPLSSRDAWLGAEKYIEANDAPIQALAGELKCSTEYDTAKAIYDWVRQNIQYAGYVADDRGALEALSQRRGDCTEYAYLVAALARANGMPARMVGGYVVDRDAAPKVEDYHNWAEVYFDGAWRLLDAQKENWLAPTEQYIAFRFYHHAVLNPIGHAHRFRIQGELQVGF